MGATVQAAKGTAAPQARWFGGSRRAFGY